MKIWWVGAACAAVLAVSGCGSGNSTATPGAESNVVVPQSGASDNGSDSGSGPDSPVNADDQGVADLPSLPIGGDASFESADSPICATVAFAWNGGTLPDGVVVRISSLGYPEGVGPDPSASCDGPPCLDADSFSADQQTCTVGLTWDGTPAADPEPSISASGTVSCQSQDVCDQVKQVVDSAQGAMVVQLPELSDPSSESS
jgi:hypothetical protein